MLTSSSERRPLPTPRKSCKERPPQVKNDRENSHLGPCANSAGRLVRYEQKGEGKRNKGDCPGTLTHNIAKNNAE
jgi:hypothetical protein